MLENINLSVFKKFINSNLVGSVVLFACLIISLLIANSPFGNGFNELLETKFGPASTSLHLNFSLSIWINDGLMAVFFLLVGLEIKRELVAGELSTPRKAMLPIICAVGGAIIPALIYTFFNKGEATAGGWGIPMATDIAFALAILTLLGNKVPPSLKIFLAALAIVDDLLAILVIAVFYSSDLHYLNLLYAGGIVALLFLFNRLGITNLAFYIIPGIIMWYFIHHSGIHATIAGVLTAITIPTNSKSKESPLERLEHTLTKPVNFIIIPLFALANTNIKFENDMIDGLFTSLSLGIVLGLLIGKPLGILLISWISVKTNLCQLPEEAGWKHVFGIGLLAGIGFTMSIFISLLSFSDPELVATAKFSILVGSVLSGLLGYLMLRAISLKKSGKL